MSVIINASTSSGLIQTADTSGTLELQSNGTTQLTVSSTGTYGQLKSGTAQASTSGTSIDFTSIPSWVKRITVMFQGVSTNGTSLVQIQLGSGSFTTSGYTSAAAVISSGTAQASSTTGFQVTGQGAAADVLTGNIVITNITSNTWTETGLIGYARTAGAMSMTSGSLALSGTLDRIRITTVNGTDTFDAGSINILYEG
jgi:hypothetical protein